MEKDSEKINPESKGWVRKSSAAENVLDTIDSLKNFSYNCYKTDHPCRGRAIIFNHYSFLDGHTERRGTDTDVENLMIALEKLGFEEKYIDVYKDLRAGDIVSTLKKVQKEDHTDRDLLMVFMLTHGGENDKILATDVEYPVEKIWEPFSADKCKSLAGKPKIFFVIACRGESVDQGLSVKDDGSLTEVDAVPIKSQTYSIPVWSDFLYVFSTYKGYYSFRNVEEGTWYIQAFCKELSKTDLSKTSFTDFLTAVNGRLSLYEAGPPFVMSKQIPIFSSTLTKRLYLKNNSG